MDTSGYPFDTRGDLKEQGHISASYPKRMRLKTRRHYNEGCPCKNGSRNALGSRQNESNVFYLFDVISTATKSIDAAIYAITARDFSDILINAHRRGVVVRILTDNEQQSLPNSQIQQLRRAGIQQMPRDRFAQLDKPGSPRQQ
ncbi:hypothetical protein EMCRGX_G027794 [Ephydatia muelleri]